MEGCIFLLGVFYGGWVGFVLGVEGGGVCEYVMGGDKASYYFLYDMSPRVLIGTNMTREYEISTSAIFYTREDCAPPSSDDV